MIVFELICSAQHRFEGWFASGEEFERQRGGGILSCPICSTARVEKLPTAKIGRPAADPAVSSPSAAAPADGPAQRVPHEAVTALAALMDHVLQTTEDVGREFAVEARRIHYDEVPRRGIRGVATREEAESLIEEGVPVLSLPIPPRDDWH